MKQIRIGIVGLGMGGTHAKKIASDNHKDFRLAAVCDIDVPKAIKFSQLLKVPYFSDAQTMFESGQVDAVIVAVPHYWHAPLTIRAARAGLHVLCEKPLAVSVGAAAAMVQQCRKHKVVLAAMLNMRTRGIMVKMKQMIDSGRLGQVYRVSAICSKWYRSQHYYATGSWRGTWDGEGGGVLTNQAPHSLDLFQWLGGLPKQVTAVLGTREHKIEVENTANVICHYGDGRMGTFYACTADAPGMEQIVVCGDKATLVCENNTLRLGVLDKPISKDLPTNPKSMTPPPCTWQDVPFDEKLDGDHINVTRAFAANILRGQKLIASGAEALNEVELCNAIYISGFKNKTVSLPVDAAEIHRLLATLERKYSTGQGGGHRAKAAREMRKLMATAK